jgi:hypothetical protein
VLSETGTNRGLCGGLLGQTGVGLQARISSDHEYLAVERDFRGTRLESYLISKSWLTIRLEPHDDEWAWTVEQLHPDFDQGDELLHFDEPAPPGINAGAIGIALVRRGEPIRTTITAVH